MIAPPPNTIVQDIVTVLLLLPLGLMAGFFLRFIVRSAVEIWNSPEPEDS